MSEELRKLLAEIDAMNAEYQADECCDPVKLNHHIECVYEARQLLAQGDGLTESERSEIDFLIRREDNNAAMEAGRKRVLVAADHRYRAAALRKLMAAKAPTAPKLPSREQFARNDALDAAAQIVRRYVDANDAQEVSGAIGDILALKRPDDWCGEHKPKGGEDV